MSTSFLISILGGWRIQITFDENNIFVTHWKKQKQLVKSPEIQEVFAFFEWELTLTFDKKVTKIDAFSFKLSNIQFHENANEQQKNDIKVALENYFANAGE